RDADVAADPVGVGGARAQVAVDDDVAAGADVDRAAAGAAAHVELGRARAGGEHREGAVGEQRDGDVPGRVAAADLGAGLEDDVVRLDLEGPRAADGDGPVRSDVQRTGADVVVARGDGGAARDHARVRGGVDARQHQRGGRGRRGGGD